MKRFVAAACAALVACASLPAQTVASYDSLLDDTVFKLAEFSVDLEIDSGVGPLSVNLKNLTCYDIGVGNLWIHPSLEDDSISQRAFAAGTKNLSVACVWETTFEAYPSFFSVKGAAITEIAFTVDELALTVGMQSDNYTVLPPTGVGIEKCTIDIDWASDFSFHISLKEPRSKLNAYLQSAQEEFADLIRETTAQALDSVLDLDAEDNAVCQAMDELARDSLTSEVVALAAYIARYQEMADMYVDRLVAEHGVGKMNEAWVDFESSDIFGMAFDAFNSGFALEDNGGIQVNSSAANLIRSITQGSGDYDIDAGNTTLVETSLGGLLSLQLDLERVVLVGLDNIKSFSPAEVYGPLTVESNITFANLRADIDMVLDLDVLSGVPASQRRRLEQFGISLQRERFRVSLDVNELAVNLAFALAINSERAWDLGFGSVLDDPFNCVLTTFDLFQASRVWGKIGAFNEIPRLTGLVSEDVNGFMQGILESLLHLYGPSGLLALPGILLEEGPDIVTSGFGTLIRDSDCPAPAPYESGEVYFDFLDDSYFRELVDVVESDVLPTLNEDYIAPMTESQSGELGVYILQEDVSMSELSIPVGTFSMSAAKIAVAGLDSMYDVHFMESPRPYVLHNAFKLGGPLPSRDERRLQSGDNSSALPPVTLSLILEMNFEGDVTNFANKFEFSITFEGFHTSLDFLAKINRTDFETMRIEQLLDLNCILARLDDAAIEAFEAGFEAIRVGLRCIECSSPGIVEMEERVLRDDYQEQFTDVMNEWIATIIERFREKIDRAQLSITIEEARQKCDGTYVKSSGSSSYHAEDGSRLNIFGIIGGMALTMIVGMSIGCCLKVGSRGCCAPCFACARVFCAKRERSMSDATSEGRAPSDSVDARISEGSESGFRRFFRFNSTASDTADIAITEDTLAVAAPSLVQQFGASGASGKDPAVVEAEFRLMKQRSSSLGFHPVIPWYASYGVLGLLCMNAFLFVLGHLVVAANINVLFTVLGDEVLMDNVAGFSIGKSIKDLWDSGIIPLALLLAGLSGAFPYIKVLTMLFCWLTPPRFVSVTRRGKILDGFDTVGKWSMIDVYVLLLIMVAFGISVENPRLNILPDGFYAVRVFVDPAVGLVCFTAAAMLSLLVNNLLVYYHRNVVDADKQALQEPKLAVAVGRFIEGSSRALTSESDGDDILDESEVNSAIDEVITARPAALSSAEARRRFSTWLETGEDKEDVEILCSRTFALPDGRRLRFTKFGQRSISGLLCVCALLIVVGLAIPSFGFRILGVIGMFMDIDEIGSWKPYSVLETFGFAVRQAFESKNDDAGYIIGVIFLSLAYLITAAFFPLFTLVGLVYLWQRPLTLSRQKWIYLITEISSAWSCVDVFVVGLIVGVLELGHISYVLLKPVCKHVMPLIDDILVPTGFVEEENATCLYISSSLEPGCALLVVGALFSNILAQIVLRAAHNAIHEREISGEPPVRDFEASDSEHHEGPRRVGCFLRGCLRIAKVLRWITFCDPKAVSAEGTAVVAAGHLAGF